MVITTEIETSMIIIECHTTRIMCRISIMIDMVTITGITCKDITIIMETIVLIGRITETFRETEKAG